MIDDEELLCEHLQQVIANKDFDPVEDAFPQSEDPALGYWYTLNSAQIAHIARKCAAFVAKHWVPKT